MDAADLSPRVGPDATRTIRDDELRDILAGLSHEIRRPLVSLRAGLDLLLDDGRAAPQAGRDDQIRLMTGLCDEMLQLTRRYLDFAGLTHGARPLLLGEYSLGALADDLDRRYRDAAADAGLRWACRLVGDDRPVTTDAASCQQILGNLADNALKYTLRGGEVCVAIGADPSGGWFARVADDGPGIPEGERERVFAPFYRLGGVGTPPSGDGLGLAICRELARRRGGTVVLDGRPGGGTVATVRMP
ncbi:MAG: HAMP domain-containing histidine kinase [Thermoleophilia bacterium]|nr:HAMP domain-containing histidine kinase [Thermoleophilia bacterium]